MIIILRRIGLSFNMRLAERFYLMVNQILISAEDRIGFQQNMKKLSFEKTAFSINIQLVKLIFGEERRASTHPKQKSFGEKSPISTYLGRSQGRKGFFYLLVKIS